MMWSKLKKQLMLIIDKDSGFDIQCSVFKTKSAWTAGQKNGISKSREMIPRYWITINKEIVWDYPKMFINQESQYKDYTINDTYFYGENYTWIADTLREYIDTPREELLSKVYEKDKYGLVNILRKYDRRISKSIRNNIDIRR